ncbi:MAG: hypothetical protein SFY32_14505 [Bacteroidota bacterium]|nr:hypothetical protein [Bacteroidota bacterium]
MKTVLLKLEENTFSETENLVAEMHISRNRYINEAINMYNKLQKRALLEKQYKFESEIVRNDSMEVLKEFEAIDTLD